MARRREVLTLALTVMLGGGVVVVGAGPAGADEGGALAFRASAEAAAVRMTMTVANGPGTNDPIDVPGPISHAAVNSLGSSSAFASFPYPGDAGVTVPGLLPAVVPGAPSLPPYPFYAKSEHPITPKAQQAAGAVNLSAESTQTASKATGSAGPEGDGPGSMSSEASVAEAGQPYLAPESTAVVATSKAVVAAFAAGPLMLGRVVSTASVTLLADGTLQRKSGLELSGVRIGDQAVGLSSNGFVAPGSGVPFPAGAQDQLRSALAGGGLTVEFLPERQTDDGIVSAGLRIRQERDMPNGRDALTWVIGQSTASAVGGVSQDSDDAPSGSAAGVSPASNGAGRELATDTKEADMKEADMKEADMKEADMKEADMKEVGRAWAS